MTQQHILLPRQIIYWNHSVSKKICLQASSISFKSSRSVCVQFLSNTMIKSKRSVISGRKLTPAQATDSTSSSPQLTPHISTKSSQPRRETRHQARPPSNWCELRVKHRALASSMQPRLPTQLLQLKWYVQIPGESLPRPIKNLRLDHAFYRKNEMSACNSNMSYQTSGLTRFRRKGHLQAQ